MGDLLLTREDLDNIKNNPIFSLWLFGNVDESQLNENEKQIIFARQLYYDLAIPDEKVYRILKLIGCKDLDSLLSNDSNVATACSLLRTTVDVVVIKVNLMQKRMVKEQNLELRREN